MKKVFVTLFCLSLSAVAVKAQDKKAQPMTPAQQQVVPAPQPTPPTPVQGRVVGGAPAPPPPTVDVNAGKFKFDEEIHFFKDVPEGPIAEFDFEFKNNGKSPIVITDAHGSCGCTVPTWPHEPILPKQKGKIHVAYTTNGRPGMIDKAITINSNAQQQPMMLYIKGNVIPKPAETTPTPVAPPAGNPVK
jgi:hypothetical protein